jgi:hypothetical protein
MNAKLSSEDQLAVDFVLDQLTRIGPATAQPVAPASTLMQAAADPVRIEAVERLLKQLETLPSPAPAADLVERTLARIGSLTTGTTATATGDDARKAPVQ